MILDPYNPQSLEQVSRDKLNSMLNHIASSNAIFKSQQINDPDLSVAEKCEIAESILFNNPVLFLTRFGDFLLEEHFQVILSFENDENKYDLDFHISSFRSNLARRKLLIRNRRFEALKRMQESGSYFSETEMERREPLLYHQLVGQYISDREKYAKYREDITGAPSLSSFLMKQAEIESLNDIRRKQEEEEANQICSSDDEVNDDEVDPAFQRSWGDDWDDEKSRKERQIKKKNRTKVGISKDEKRLLLQEFRTHLFTKFLDGLDVDFDYGLVDNNPEYDCLKLCGQDAEDKYFDDETCDDILCTDTGVEDY